MMKPHTMMLINYVECVLLSNNNATRKYFFGICFGFFHPSNNNTFLLFVLFWDKDFLNMILSSPLCTWLVFLVFLKHLELNHLAVALAVLVQAVAGVKMVAGLFVGQALGQLGLQKGRERGERWLPENERWGRWEGNGGRASKWIGHLLP